MPRPSKEPPVRTTLVPALIRHVQSCDRFDAEAWQWRFGLPPDIDRLEEFTAPPDSVEEMFQAAAMATSAQDVASRVAADLCGRKQPLAELAVRASRDVRDALCRLARWTPLLQEGLEARVEDERWILRSPRRPRGVGRYVHEVALAYPLLRVRDGAGDVRAERAWFVHPRPRTIEAVRVFFGTTDLAFGCEDSGFSLAPETLARPMRHADPHTVATVAPLVDAELASRPGFASLGDRVAAHLATSLPEASDVGDVAHAMHMSARTLQRRLEQEGTTFSEVLDRARLQVARGLLSNSALPLAEVAFRLGFSDVATFSRAFKRWTGMPPGQWRLS
jgi:AraC-like DNA-binding protein